MVKLTARTRPLGALVSSLLTAVLVTSLMLLGFFLGGSSPQVHRQTAGHLNSTHQQHLPNTTGLTMLEAAQWAAILSASLQANLLQSPVQRPNITSNERSLSSRQFEAVTGIHTYTR
jgi:hypothetical protein